MKNGGRRKKWLMIAVVLALNASCSTFPLICRNAAIETAMKTPNAKIATYEIGWWVKAADLWIWDQHADVVVEDKETGRMRWKGGRPKYEPQGDVTVWERSVYKELVEIYNKTGKKVGIGWGWKKVKKEEIEN